LCRTFSSRTLPRWLSLWMSIPSHGSCLLRESHTPPLPIVPKLLWLCLTNWSCSRVALWVLRRWNNLLLGMVYPLFIHLPHHLCDRFKVPFLQIQRLIH
jgi:hypothetical protein